MTKHKSNKKNESSNIKKNIFTLVMIVKNESKIITRLLDSVINIVDNICICDTGSTDNTIEIINKWSKQYNKICQVPEYKFINFSINRTKSIYFAKTFFPKTDYFLALDADMILKVEPSFKKDLLDADMYLIPQISKTSRYYNARILKNMPTLWMSIGVTHEFWTNESTKNNKRIDNIYIDDREDGGCKSDKFVRDERLFKEALTKEGQEKFLKLIKEDETLTELYDYYNNPNYTKDGFNGRYYYYLGQTQMSLYKYKDAISNFRHRATYKFDNNFEEEAWYAQFRIGQCYEKLADDIKYDLKCIKKFIDGDNSEPIFTRVNTRYSNLTNPHSIDYRNEVISKLEDDIVTYTKLAMYEYDIAHYRRPFRNEPLMPLIYYYRTNEFYNKALDYALKAKNNPLPNDGLFVDYKNYKCRSLDVDIILCAYFIKDKMIDGVNSCISLLDNIINKNNTNIYDIRYDMTRIKYFVIFPKTPDKLNILIKCWLATIKFLLHEINNITDPYLSKQYIDCVKDVYDLSTNDKTNMINTYNKFNNDEINKLLLNFNNTGLKSLYDNTYKSIYNK